MIKKASALFIIWDREVGLSIPGIDKIMFEIHNLVSDIL